MRPVESLEPASATGPYETEQDAAAAPMPREWARLRYANSREVVVHEALLDACLSAGIKLGAFDRRIVRWLCNWEPATVQVVIGLIRRAARRDGCTHQRAQVEAYIGRPGAENPDNRGLPWEVLHPEQRDLDGLHTYVALGACECGRRVVSVRSWEPAGGTPAWTSPWTPLVRDGEAARRERT